MNKVVYLLIAAVIVAGGYFYIKNTNRKDDKNSSSQMTTYRNDALGLQFDYRTGPTGYVLEEHAPTTAGTGQLKVIILKPTQNTLQSTPSNTEGYPVMSIAVFESNKKQSARFWADHNAGYSNINLKTGQVVEAVVGSANGVRYLTSGVYSADTAVIAQGNKMYVFTGQFVDKDSALRRDFGPLLESVNFISASVKNK